MRLPKLSPPKAPTWRDLILLIIPALLWVGMIKMRPHWIRLVCMEGPQACVVENIPAFDRAFMISESERAHHVSYKTQNSAGYLSFLVPAGIHTLAMVTRAVNPGAGLIALAADVVFVGKVSLWNGALNEAVKISTNRVRPHVYKHPEFAGDNPAHYTSFWSGHTSYAATASMALLFVLLWRGVSRRFLWLFILSGAALTVSTAVLRVAAGRHFFSDVVVGAIMGSLVAWFWARPQRRNL